MTDFPFDIVGFDLDGTLLDTHADLGNAVNHALSRAGRRAVPITDMPMLIGGGSRAMLTRALERTGGTVGLDQEALYADLLTYYRANIARHTGLFPGGETMLDALQARGVKLAVVTNKLESLAVQLLEELGLLARFAAVLGGDTLGPGRAKPAPDLLLEMRARLGRGRAVFIGDTTYDIDAARAAAMPCVAVTFGFNDRPAGELGADAVISHFDALIPALEAF